MFKKAEDNMCALGNICIHEGLIVAWMLDINLSESIASLVWEIALLLKYEFVSQWRKQNNTNMTSKIKIKKHSALYQNHSTFEYTIPCVS